MNEATLTAILKLIPLEWVIVGFILWGAVHYGRYYVKIFFEHKRESKRIGLEHERRQSVLAKRLEDQKYKRRRRK